MIDLYQFSPAFGVPNLSPFCMKVEAFLRISNIPFQIIHENDPSKGPKGKLPFIRDNGVLIGDSERIIDYLERKLDFRVDGHLDSRELAVHHAFGRMLDEHLYWVLMYSRWLDDSNWPTLRNELFYDIPPPISTLMARKIRNRMRDALHGQGLGRHNREEIYQKGCRDLEQLSVLLGNRRWFGGDYIARLDLAATAYLANILIAEMPGPLADFVRATDNLEAYVRRTLPVLFPEPLVQAKRPPF